MNDTKRGYAAWAIAAVAATLLAGLPAPYALAAVLLGACVPAVCSLFVFRRLRRA